MKKILRSYQGDEPYVDDRSAVPEQPREPVSPITDFEIENGVLKEYLGNSETVVIPHGITRIGNKAFQ